MSGTASAVARGRGLSSFVVVALGFSFIGIQDGALGVLLPSLQSAYGLTESGVGGVFFAAMAGYLMAATLTGPIVGRLGLRAFLAGGSLLVLLSFGLVASAPPWVVLIGTLGVAGFGTAMLDAGMNAHVAQLPQRARLLNYVHAIYGGGALAGPLVASRILATGGSWELVYVAMAALALVLAAGFAVAFPAGGARTVDVVEPMGMARSGLLAEALALPVVRVVALFMALYLGLEVTAGSWTFSVLTEVRGQSMGGAGWTISCYWAGLAAGRLLLGRLAQGQPGPRLIPLCLVGVAAGMLGLWLLPGTAAAVVCLTLIGLCIGPVYPTTIATVAGAVPGRVVPAAVGLLTSVGALGGSLVPWLAGVLAMRVGIGALPPSVALLAGLLALLWRVSARSMSPVGRVGTAPQTSCRAVAPSVAVERV